MNKSILIGSQMYPSWQVYNDQPGGYDAHLAEVLAAHAAAGFDAWELSLNTDQALNEVSPLLEATGLKLPSVYAGAKLHTADWSEGVEKIVAAGRRAKKAGATIITCNPDPISWGGADNKTDDELHTQCRALQTAGEALAAEGMRFAYHWHDPEFRCGAREIWNVLLNTDPKIVGVCFDTHWTYRGTGNSQAGLFDLLELTLPRIHSVHVRQSRDGVWSETFGEGDIDYRRGAAWLKKAGWTGPVHLEQAREEGTPRTMSFMEAETQGLNYLRSLLD